MSWGYLDQVVGVTRLVLLGAYIAWAYSSEHQTHDAGALMHEHLAEDAAPSARSLGLSLGIAVARIAATVLGARLLVDGAIELAPGLSISETVIGLTVVVVGTSHELLSAPGNCCTVWTPYRGGSDWVG